MNVDWENLTADELKWLHEWGKDFDIRANGYGEQLDKYLSAIETGIEWDPNDMVGTPNTPAASRLNAQGQRETVVVHLPGQSDDDDDDGEVPPYEEWDREDLIAECQARGLVADGSDEDLAMRLMEYDEAAEANKQPAIQVDYDRMRKAELQDELRRRGLDPNGKNDELIARLQEDDQKGE